MNGMIGMASLLHDTELTPRQREYLDTIESSGRSLLTDHQRHPGLFQNRSRTH